jgi:hypothetical protein
MILVRPLASAVVLPRVSGVVDPALVKLNVTGSLALKNTPSILKGAVG